MALGNVNVAGVMKSDIKEVQQNINDLIGQTENTGGTVTEGTVMAKLNSLLSYIEKGNGLKIKSLQHGEVAFHQESRNGAGNGALGGERYRYITINSVNIDKSILLVEHHPRLVGTSSGYSYGFVKLQSNNTLAQLNYGGYASGNNVPNPYTRWDYNPFVYYVLEFE